MIGKGQIPGHKKSDFGIDGKTTKAWCASQDFVDKQRFFVYCTVPNPELIYKWGSFFRFCCFLSYSDKPRGTRRESGTKND